MNTVKNDLCSCGSDDTELVSSEEGVEVYYCFECDTYFENDTFIPHTRKVRNMRDDHYERPED